ncbi:hypothetical protein F4808DRAFT_447348, partial [Astrocystis sublimbata]
MWTAKEALNIFPEKPLEGSQSPIPYFHLLERLKTTRREGWKRHGINGESIADHSYRMALMAMMAPTGLDTNKCIQMCLIHDIAESLVCDITPADGIPKEEKERRERSTIDWIADDLLPNVDGGHGEKIRTIGVNLKPLKPPRAATHMTLTRSSFCFRWWSTKSAQKARPISASLCTWRP